MSEKVQQAISQTNFTTLDWGIVVCYLLISVVIGLLVKKYAANTSEFEDKILALYAKGMSVRDIEATFRELYDVEVSAQTVSSITDSSLVID